MRSLQSRSGCRPFAPLSGECFIALAGFQCRKRFYPSDSGNWARSWRPDSEWLLRKRSLAATFFSIPRSSRPSWPSSKTNACPESVWITALHLRSAERATYITPRVYPRRIGAESLIVEIRLAQIRKPYIWWWKESGLLCLKNGQCGEVLPSDSLKNG